MDWQRDQMDFEFNKIMGAVLGTCLFLLSLNIAAGALYTPVKPAKPGFEVAVQEQTKSGSPPSSLPSR